MERAEPHGSPPCAIATRARSEAESVVARIERAREPCSRGRGDVFRGTLTRDPCGEFAHPGHIEVGTRFAIRPPLAVVKVTPEP